MALPGAYAPASIALQATGKRKPLHVKVVVLEKDIYVKRKKFINRECNKIYKTKILQKCVAISVMRMCWFNSS
jgi:hypothetical protein